MKNKKDTGGLIYSTNSQTKLDSYASFASHTPPPAEQDLRVLRDSKQRGGKTVTLVTGFKGKEDDLKELGKILKTKCGTGGTVKDGEIIIQGDQRDKVFNLLVEMKYGVKKAGG